MSASLYRGRSRSPLRVGLAVIVGLVYLGEALNVASMADQQPFSWRHAALTSLVRPTRWVIAAVSVGVFAALYAFARARRPVTAGLAATVGMALVAQWNTELFGSPSRNFFIPGAAFFGWVCGVAYARSLAPSGDSRRATEDAFGEAGAMGVFAAVYVGSAASKLLRGGIDWIHPDTLRFLVLSQHGLADVGWINAYRAAVIESPGFATLLSGMTLLIEGGAFMLLVGRAPRVVWSALIFALHANVLVLCTMPYLEPMAIVALFGLPWPSRPEPATPEESLAPRRAVLSWRVWAVVAALITLAWTLPVGWRPTRGDTDSARLLHPR